MTYEVFFHYIDNEGDHVNGSEIVAATENKEARQKVYDRIEAMNGTDISILRIELL